MAAVRREPAKGRAGARVLRRPGRVGRRGADARTGHRRMRDGARLPAGGRVTRPRRPADQRRPRRDPCARRPDRRHLRGRDRRRAQRRDGDGRGARPADGRRLMRIERRLRQPWWLTVVVPVVSIAVALLLSAVVLVLTGHAPVHSFRRLVDAAFSGKGALSDTIVSATPLIFTGLAAAVAFRMNLFNIGGEGQLYAGAITAATIALLLGGAPSPLVIAAMVLAGAAGGALLAAIPGVLRAFFSTNEIITSLMLNYVVALVISYLIFDSESYWRDTSSPTAKVFPQGKTIPDSAAWPVSHVGSLV